MKDYYSVLGIRPTASYVEIRKAYRKLALELHPDVSNSSKAKEDFLEINEAYRVLKYVHSRNRYDRLHRIHILKNEAHNKNRFDKKRGNWSATRDKRANSGRERGEKDAEVDPKKFKKKQSFWGIFDILGAFLEIFSIFG